MTSSSSNPMEIVSALMLERQRYEGWLGTLETRRSDTPPHVYERVRGDYEARLQAVMTQLSQRTTELQETVSVLEARLARVLADENAKRDAKYEAELRAAVGEFTPSEWNALLSKSDDEINRLSSERGGIATELARVRQIYAMASNRAQTEQAAMSAGGTSALPAGGRADAGGKKDGAKDSGRKSRDVASGAASAGFDELAFLNSLGEAASSSPSTGAQGGSSAPATAGSSGTRAPTPSASSPSIPKLAGIPEASGAPVHAASGPSYSDEHHPSAAAAPAGKADAKPAAAKIADKSEKSDVSKRRETNGVPSFLKDVPVEQIKTLKCAECGTMNYPTEWYCERCGGELAAM